MMNILRIPVRRRIGGVAFILLFLWGLTAAHSGIIEMSAIGMGGKIGERTVTLEFTEAVDYSSFTLDNPPRLVLDIPGATLKESRTIELKNEIVGMIKCEQYQPDSVRVVVNLTQPAKSRVRKRGKKLLLAFSLPRETKVRLLDEERAKAKAEREMKEKLAAQERTRIKQEQEEAERLARAGKEELKAKKEEARKIKAEKEAQEREAESRRRAEERAKQLLGRKLRRGAELQSREAISEKKLAEETARREAKEREKKLGTYLTQGNKYYQDDRFEEAVREFEAVLGLDPENKEAGNYLPLAREKLEEERRQEEIRRQEEEKEKQITDYLNQGKKYYLQGRYGETISAGEKMLVLSPDHEQAEELIWRAKKKILEMDKKRAQAEKEIVEGRRTLDVTRAVYTSPIDYVEAINPDEKVVSAAGPEPGEKMSKEDAATEGLKKQVEETRVTMNFKDTNLSEVIFYLSKLSGVTIALDETALDELENPNVSIYTPAEIPLTDALDLVLKVKGLDYVVKENYIWITKKGRLEDDEVVVTEAYKLKYGIRKVRAVTLEIAADEEE